MKKAGKTLFIIIMVLTISLRMVYLLGPVDPNADRSIQLIIKKGTTAGQIANRLYENNLIRSKLLFNILISIQGLENSLQAGTYDIKTSYGMGHIIYLLVEGRVATFRVTIPEGFTVEEVTGRLSVMTPYSKEEYLNYAKQDMGRDYLKVSGKEIKYALEGFLYPDTYIIPITYTPEQIFEVMLSVFEERWLDRLNRISYSKNSNFDLSQKRESSKQEDFNEIVSQFTTHQIMTIASLIEEEAKLNEEKPLVAAVIYNRLKRNMLLQIDACIQYIMSNRKDRVLYSDLGIDSPYNTYMYRGLPPGPISNPGASSIEAALNPADVDYLFYFARKDGSHVFSHSYKEHMELQYEMRDN